MSVGSKAQAFILAGGRGTRFWPLSRHAHPKQLLDFTGQGSLLSLGSQRISQLIDPERQWVITSEDLVPAVQEALPEIPSQQILGEPIGRNTAPAVALAAMLSREKAGETTPFAILPSDHLISPDQTFCAKLEEALQLAVDYDSLLTFGIEASSPETGYGYIEAGEAFKGSNALAVTAFREKPDLKIAQSYVESGYHYWNSGIFAWTPKAVLEGMQKHSPEIVHALRGIETVAAKVGTPDFAKAFKTAYESSPSISIDYALLEKAENVLVLPADFHWNDLGHWLAMRDLWSCDEDNNASMGNVLSVDSKENIVYGPDRLTALLGVENIIVVQTGDITLVADARRSQDIKQILDRLKSEKKDEFL